MFPPEVFRDTLQRLAGVLDRLSIRFHLTGGITTLAYGEPRMTQDFDIVVDPEGVRRCFDDLLAALRSADFLVDTQAARQAASEGGMFQALDLVESLKIDLYPRQMIAGELDRSVQLEVFEGLMLPVAARVDAVVSKLVWISKGSHKSRRDLRQILTGASAAERAAVGRHAEERGLASLLAEVLAEPDQIQP
jgi:hypothetical protein